MAAKADFDGNDQRFGFRENGAQATGELISIARVEVDYRRNVRLVNVALAGRSPVLTEVQCRSPEPASSDGK